MAPLLHRAAIITAAHLRTSVTKSRSAESAVGLDRWQELSARVSAVIAAANNKMHRCGPLARHRTVRFDRPVKPNSKDSLRWPAQKAFRDGQTL